MKISQTPTEWLIVKADTESEWDNVDFALIHVTDEFKTDLRRWHSIVSNFINSLSDDDRRSLGAITFYDEVDWYRFDTTDDEQSDIQELLEDGYPRWLEISDDEMESLDRPEQDVKYGHITIHLENCGWTAYDKHTGEEFTTEGIKIDFILNNIKPE